MSKLKWFLLVFAIGLFHQSVVAQTLSERVLTTLREDCGNCHGMYRNGGLGPALDPSSLNKWTPEALATVIRFGRPDKFMPPWESVLSTEEIQFLANYLLTVVPEKPQVQPALKP
ncbi:MAG: cytochrome c [SAR324 cluster bacterium]|nr:cytochrome c [SAR324 cluster bacterium]